MAAPTIAQFKAAYPEFSSTSDDDITRKMGIAYEVHKKSLRATLALCAHLIFAGVGLSTSKHPGTLSAGGNIKTETAGDLSTTFMTAAEITQLSGSASREFFSSSIYGREFMLLEERATAFSVSISY